ncbi:MAG: SGNH/GDSL hydrolase family protein [Ramlibacter sp.]
MKLSRRTWAAMGAALLVAACGGGGEIAPKASISKVYVMGDSLADVGTFGFKFTVQDSSNPKGFPIWPQLVANTIGVNGSAQCNFFLFNGTTYVANPTAGCTNYAIGGGRIVTPAAQGGATNPQTVGTQLATRAAAGNYVEGELVLIDGGGNDAADLVGAYLGAASGAAGVAAYQAFLAQQLDAATIGGALTQPNGAAIAAGAYMQKLADTFYASIKANTLDKGANRVAVLNMPDITLTPRFQAVLTGVAAASGGGTAGATAAAQLQGAIQQWISAFNAKLKANIGADSRVALVDFYTDFTDEVKNPASYGLANAKTPACPATGVDSSGLPTYTFQTCTSNALNAAPPTGVSGTNWFNTYAFSDSFHPTPYGHQLLAASVNRALARAGWL